MVSTVTSLSSNGLRDWLFQRITAVILGVYFLLLLGFVLCHPHLTYALWHQLFAHPLMKIITFLALLSLVLHAWSGMWIVFTDYIKVTGLRLFLQVVMIILLFAYLAWGILILWGI